MAGRFLSVCLVVLWLSVGGGATSAEDDASDLVMGDLPQTENGVLRAFEGPNSEDVKVAAKRVFGVIIGAVFFVILLFFVLAFFYDKKSGLPTPTPTRGAKDRDAIDYGRDLVVGKGSQSEA